jgi:chitodextrinase
MAFAFTQGDPAASRLSGTLVASHGDDFAHGRPSAVEYLLQNGDGTVPVRGVSTAQAARLLGKRVVATPQADGTSELTAADGTTGATTTTTTTTTSTGPHRVAIVLFNFSNNTAQPYTPAAVAGNAFTNSNSVAAYYSTNSWGQLTLTGDVFGWYTIADTNSSCDYTTWQNSANSAAAAAGVDLSKYDNVVYSFPSSSACGWSGLAYAPGKYSWLNGSALSLRTMAHELGHNFGTHHASSYSCTDSGVRVSLSANASNCTASEYGDPFSIMGQASSRNHTNVSLGNFKWLPTANTLDVTSSGTYTLAPSELDASGTVQYIRILRSSGVYLTLELRQPGISPFDAFSSTDPVVNGVTIRLAGSYSSVTQSRLIDTTPSTSSFNDAPLAVGQSFADPLTGISITTVSVSPSGASVRISFGGSTSTTTDTTPPTQPASLTAKATDSTHVTLSWTASSDNIGVTGYRVYRNSTLIGSVTSTGYADSGLSATTSYAYQVIAVDAAGNASTAAGASVATPPAADTSSPTQPGSLTASATDSTHVTLSWTASTDNVSVAGYRVYRNSTVLATVTTTAYADSGLTASTAYGYQVIAFDAAGNASTSVAVSVTTPAAPQVDTQPPTAPAGLTATAAKGKKFVLAWNASTDNIGVVGYRVYRDGNIVATTTSTAYSDTLGGKSPTATYSVVAFDAAGNISAASPPASAG